MKKCVQCRAQIERMVPFSVCCGGAGNVSEVDHQEEEAAAKAVEPIGGALMNNGSRDISSTDIQKLQQQLQDIKEQV